MNNYHDAESTYVTESGLQSSSLYHHDYIVLQESQKELAAFVASGVFPLLMQLLALSGYVKYQIKVDCKCMGVQRTRTNPKNFPYFSFLLFSSFSGKLFGFILLFILMT